MLKIDSLQGIASAAQWNVVEFHTQNATAADYEHPDRIVFDLDPGERVSWATVREGAQLLNALLKELGLSGFLKTSGGKGLHIVVPLRPKLGWDAVKDLAGAVTDHMARTIPARFVAKSGAVNRVGKIFIDYLRNGRGSTTVTAWSARARPGLGISVPLRWNELATVKSADQWHLGNVRARFKVGNAPWNGYADAAASLDRALEKLGTRTRKKVTATSRRLPSRTPPASPRPWTCSSPAGRGVHRHRNPPRRLLRSAAPRFPASYPKPQPSRA